MASSSQRGNGGNRNSGSRNSASRNGSSRSAGGRDEYREPRRGGYRDEYDEPRSSRGSYGDGRNSDGRGSSSK